MSRRPAAPVEVRRAYINFNVPLGTFNQLKMIRDLGISRDTARRDTKKFMRANPWAFRYDQKLQAYAPCPIQRTPVAQRLEPSAHNGLAGGSNPSGRTNQGATS